MACTRRNVLLESPYKGLRAYTIQQMGCSGKCCPDFTKSLTRAVQTGARHKFSYSPSLQPVLDKQHKNRGRLLQNMPNSGLPSTVIINPGGICGRGRVCSVLGADVKQVTGVGLQLIQSVTAVPRRRRRRWFLCLGILTRLLMMITAATHVLWTFTCL